MWSTMSRAELSSSLPLRTLFKYRCKKNILNRSGIPWKGFHSKAGWYVRKENIWKRTMDECSGYRYVVWMNFAMMAGGAMLKRRWRNHLKQFLKTFPTEYTVKTNKNNIKMILDSNILMYVCVCVYVISEIP